MITEIIHGNVLNGLLHILSYYPHPFVREEYGLVRGGHLYSNSHDILSQCIYIISSTLCKNLGDSYELLCEIVFRQE